MERIRAFIFDYRRPLAAAFAALAVLAAIESLQPEVAQSSVTVAARDLTSGREVTAADVKTIQVPEHALPQNTIDSRAAVGRRVAGAMRTGEAFTDRRVVSPRGLDGQSLSMIPIDDRASLIGLRVGDKVDVVAAATGDSGARVVVAGAVVATLPRSDNTESASVGLTSAPPDAIKLADASTRGGLRLVVRS